MRANTITENLKCMFTEAELKEKAIHLAQECRSMEDVEKEKKQVMQDFNAKLAAHSAKVGLLSNNINNGYEYRYVKCDVIYDRPVAGKKTIIRQDTFLPETVKVENMTTTEIQGELFDENENGLQFKVGDRVQIKAFMNKGFDDNGKETYFNEFVEAIIETIEGNSVIVKVDATGMSHELKIDDIEPIQPAPDNGIPQEVLETADIMEPWDSPQKRENER